MKTYFDANALIRLYLELPGSHGIQRGLKSPGVTTLPVPVTELLRFEVMNGIHRMVFESRHGGPWRVTPESAACALSDFESDIADGVFLRLSTLTLSDLRREFTSLVSRHTARDGFRTYDILHVAAALALGGRRFVSFDAKALKLAKLVGLRTN